MNYNAALNDVLKYGAAPTDRVSEAIRSAADEGPVSHTTLNDQMLQDFLQDHDDPREVIVRKQREMRETNTGPYTLAANLVGSTQYADWGTPENDNDPHVGRIETPNGAIDFHSYAHKETGKRAYRVDWHAHDGQHVNRTYTAVLPPEEAHAIHSKLTEHFGGPVSS